MELSRWFKFCLSCILLLGVGLIKANFFIYMTIRMYGIEYSPISHFQEGFYRFFEAMPQFLLKPIKFAAFGAFMLFYLFYQKKTLRYFFPDINFNRILGYFFGVGALLLLILLPLSKNSAVLLGIYSGITEVYLSPLPMILCFLFIESTSTRAAKVR